MNIVETVSTLIELIVADATLKETKLNIEKINPLDTKVQDTIAMFMNTHVRFISEDNFYQARQRGLVAEEDVTKLMLAAQEESYEDNPGSYHPRFWAGKLHFFIGDVPFCSFPCTFDYPFNMGIYAHANQQGSSPGDQYIALLRDTVSTTSEELAKKHLNVDLTKPDF